MHLFEIYSEEAQEIIKTLSKDTVNALASLYLEKNSFTYRNPERYKTFGRWKNNW